LSNIEDERVVEPLIAALKDEDSDVRGSAAEALDNIDKTILKKLHDERQKNAIKITLGGNKLFEILHKSKKYTKENPIKLKESEAIIYTESNRCILSIPTGLSVRESRKIEIDIEKKPDNYVFQVLQEAPNWCLSHIPEGKIYHLMKSDWVFDYDNPIIVGYVAYIYYDDNHKEWYLRIPLGSMGEKSIEICKISPINNNIDKAVIDFIAGVGLSMT